MRFPNDKSFHLRMAALVIGSLCLEQLAKKHLANWSSPEIGVITFVLGLAWVALTTLHFAKAQHERLKVAEDQLQRLREHVDALEDDRRARRSLPPMG